MLLIPFLNQRQIGTKSCSGFRASDYRLNLDSLLSRFTCWQKDVFTVQGEDSDVPPFACKFRRDVLSDLLAVANEDGDILLYNTSDGISKAFVKSFTAHHNAVFDICWLPGKCQLLTASGDHCAALWDISTCNFISAYKSHTASVKSVDACHSHNALFATGSRDGSICVWDAREHSHMPKHKPAAFITNAHSRKNSLIVSGKKNSCANTKDVFSSVSCVAFQDCYNLASAGVADGVVKIWDLRKTYALKNKSASLPRYQMNYCEEKFSGHGCTSLVFDSLYKTLYACGTNSKIYQFDCHSYSNDVLTYEGFRCSTYFVKMALSCDDQYLLCGSSDDKAYIWKTTKPGLPILELPGHSAEVTSVTWSPYTLTKLVTCGDDNRVLVWRLGSEQNLETPEIMSSCSAYCEGSKQVSPFKSNDDGLDLQYAKHERRLSLPTPKVSNKPVLKVITNFFSPVMTSPCTRPHQNSLDKQENNVDANKSDHRSNVVPSKNSATSVSNQISCSKILNDKNILEATPCKDVFNTNLNSEIKKAETAPPALCSSVKNKENKINECQNIFSSKTNKIGQTKRKLSFHPSTPKVRRTTSHGCGKGSNKASKKHQFLPGKTIMNYFSVNLSPEN